MGQTYMVIPHEYEAEMELLTDEEFGRLMRSLLRYSIKGEKVKGEGNERFFARRVMEEEDRHQRRYEAVCEGRKLAGRAGGVASGASRRRKKAEREKKKETKQNEANEAK